MNISRDCRYVDPNPITLNGLCRRIEKLEAIIERLTGSRHGVFGNDNHFGSGTTFGHVGIPTFTFNNGPGTTIVNTEENAVKAGQTFTFNNGSWEPDNCHNPNDNVLGNKKMFEHRTTFNGRISNTFDMAMAKAKNSVKGDNNKIGSDVVFGNRD